MSESDAAIGLMEGAYFVSKTELLDFFNTLLELNLTKIEQTCTGAVACQLIEYVYPGSVPLSKVNWEAKSDFEYVANYKLLQNAFSKHHIRRFIEVERLCRGKYQDNLEFCQWLKAFFDQKCGGDREGYDALVARSKGRGGKKYQYNRTTTTSPSSSSSTTAKQTNSTQATTRRSRPLASSSDKPQSTTTSTTAAQRRSSAATVKKPPTRSSASTNKTTARSPNTNTNSNSNNEAVIRLTKKNEILEKRNSELDLFNQNLETERDFYLNKLRDIEMMMQIQEERKEAAAVAGGGASHHDQVTTSDAALVKRIYKILYATEDDVIQIDEDGRIIGYESDIECISLDDEMHHKDDLPIKVGNDDIEEEEDDLFPEHSQDDLHRHANESQDHHIQPEQPTFNASHEISELLAEHSLNETGLCEDDDLLAAV